MIDLGFNPIPVRREAMWTAGWKTEKEFIEEFEAKDWQSGITYLAGTLSLLADDSCEQGDYDAADCYDAHSEDIMRYPAGTEIATYHCNGFIFYLKKG